MSVTMKDLANELGISAVTVSKALSDKDGVSEPVRQKIKDLAQARGYRMNHTAKQLKSGNINNIGILMSELFGQGPETFYSGLYSRLALQLTQMDYSSALEIVTPEMEAKKILPSMLSQGKVDGLIILGQISEEYLDLLGGTPLILLDFYTDTDKYLSVTTNNFYSSFLITNYLISCGHKNIGFLGNPWHSTSSIQDRFLGFYKSLLEHDLPFREEWIIKDRSDRGRIKVHFELPDELPTAFVCNCDESAYKLIEHLNQEGIRVPEDISIVGFDDSVYSSISKPAITTVAVNIELLTIKASELIIQCLQRAENSASVVIPGKIVYRDSVRVLNKT